MSLPHTVDDLEEDDELANSDIREAYKQHSNNQRAFMVLRFRHFATFAVIMAFVSTGVFQISELTEYKQFVVGFGIVITILFWVLDHRTAQYLKYHAAVARAIENVYFKRERRIQLSEISAPKPRFMSATMATNVIFFLVLVGWCGFMWLVLKSAMVPTVTASAANPIISPVQIPAVDPEQAEPTSP